MFDTNDDVERRIIDEVLNEATGGKARIEDLNREVDDSADFIGSLAKGTMVKIIDHIKQATITTAKMGIPPMSRDMILAQTGFMFSIYLEELMRCWNTIQMAMADKQFKRAADRYEKSK